MADQAHPQTADSERARVPESPPAPPRRTTTDTGEGARSPFEVFKPGQGSHVRAGTAIGAGLISLSAAHFVWNRLQLFAVIGENVYLHTAIPLVVLAACAYLIFWLVGRNETTVNFLIATEGEMKKVNWSSRKEVWGATRVVIVTVFALGLILFLVDLFFIIFFSGIGVLKFDIMRQFFGQTPEM